MAFYALNIRINRNAPCCFRELWVRKESFGLFIFLVIRKIIWVAVNTPPFGQSKKSSRKPEVTQTDLQMTSAAGSIAELVRQVCPKVPSYAAVNDFSPIFRPKPKDASVFSAVVHDSDAFFPQYLAG
jgi:hypothetical protein